MNDLIINEATELTWEEDCLPIETPEIEAPLQEQSAAVKAEPTADTPPTIEQINEIVLESSLSPIAGWMSDPEITDILVYGKERVYYRKRGSGFKRDFNAFWETDADILTAAKTIARRMGRKISNRDPILDARLPDKSRVNVIVEPCYHPGAFIAIRKFPEEHFTLDDLARFGSIDSAGTTILETIMRYGQNILIAGGTGSGKTTLLNSLCGFIPPHEVVVTVEDAREICVPCELWAPLETKHAVDNEDREISLRDLIRTSLRMNPRWVIVGEVRGKEAFDLVRAFNTGHYGAGTIHANSAFDALDALEMLVLLSGLDVPPRAIKGLVSRTIHIVIHVNALPDHSRVVSEIVEVEGLDYERSPTLPPYKTRTLYEYQFDRYDANGKAVGKFVVKEPPSWVNKLKRIPNFKMPDFWQNKGE